MPQYLDVSPMIQALREAPSDFEMRSDMLYHRPSRHSVDFADSGRAAVHARCGCAALKVNPAQSRQLKEAIEAWAAAYWQPLLEQRAAFKQAAAINRHFARHFRRSRWRRWRARLAACLSEEAAAGIAYLRGVPQTPPRERLFDAP